MHEQITLEGIPPAPAVFDGEDERDGAPIMLGWVMICAGMSGLAFLLGAVIF